MRLISQLMHSKNNVTMPDRFPYPFDRAQQEKPPTPEEYHGVLETAVLDGLIPKDYADSIRDRSPKWGVEHIKQIKERERLFAKMSSNETYGLTEDHLFELRQRDPNYALRHLEYLQKREALIVQLQGQDLLDDDTTISIRKLEDPWYACKQLAELGNREIVDKTLPLLRPAEKLIERFNLPPEGESITKHVVESLKQQGLYRVGLKVRVIARERLQKAISSGTDRDHTSLVTVHHGGDDGEELAMKENGLDAMRDLGQVTYVSELDTWSDDRKKHGDMVILVYAPEALKPIQPSESKSNSSSNGFHMFLDKRLVQRSLLAVFS
jgi:hypothetical protein